MNEITMELVRILEIQGSEERTMLSQSVVDMAGLKPLNVV
jgi:hypothetical protein